MVKRIEGEFDYIIAGAGTAGCIVANRLSENPKNRVLILEAGGNDNWIWFHIPVGYLFAIGNPRSDWMFKTEPEPGLNGRALSYPRGKVIGGSSAINAMISMRGQAADYDHWRQFGLTGWGWDDVLPVFRSLEDHFLGNSEHHGTGGGWRIEAPRLSWTILDAIGDAAEQMGIPRIPDFNTGNNEGVSYFHVNQKRGRRWSAARGFLKPALTRSNLRLETNVLVDRLIIENGRAVGVRFSRGGEAFEARSRSGRILAARYVAGSDAAVMISGGQHPNETTGIVGAIRAARKLAERRGAHFTISPLENPDGYALHQRLRADNPRHMHHAARYTALGDDLEYRTRENSGVHLNEKAIRFRAQEMSGASLHVNLHGYPSHEWTRPLSGYVPRNFAMWTLPKGFFLIIRHHADWERQAEALLDRVTRHLGAIPGLLDYNNRQIALYEIHAGETGFRIINGFPCLSSVDDRHTVPMTLITEYPDETIYGNDFITGHTAQMETVLSAYDAWQEILVGEVA